MRKAVRSIGVLLIVLGAAGMALGLLFLFAYKNTLDGSASLYARQLRLTLLFLAAGTAAAVIGILCLVRSRKKR